MKYVPQNECTMSKVSFCNVNIKELDLQQLEFRCVVPEITDTGLWNIFKHMGHVKRSLILANQTAAEGPEPAPVEVPEALAGESAFAAAAAVPGCGALLLLTSCARS
jgi:hypothetical protein